MASTITSSSLPSSIPLPPSPLLPTQDAILAITTPTGVSTPTPTDTGTTTEKGEEETQKREWPRCPTCGGFVRHLPLHPPPSSSLPMPNPACTKSVSAETGTSRISARGMFFIGPPSVLDDS